MQGPSETAKVNDGVLTGSLGPNTLTIYTTAYDDNAPRTVQGLTRTKQENGTLLIWQPSIEADFCYYCVYRTRDANMPPGPDHQIPSTVVHQYLNAAAADHESGYYWVAAVD